MSRKYNPVSRTVYGNMIGKIAVTALSSQQNMIQRREMRPFDILLRMTQKKQNLPIDIPSENCTLRSQRTAGERDHRLFLPFLRFLLLCPLG